MTLRTAVAAAAVVAAMGIGKTTFAQHEGHEHGKENTAKSPGTVTVTGRLIDLGCYMMGMEGGDKHVKCAMSCAEKGVPVGLKAAEGDKVYTVVLPAPKLAAYMEKTVRITGNVHAMSLLSPVKMEIQEGDAWKAVELPAAM